MRGNIADGKKAYNAGAKSPGKELPSQQATCRRVRRSTAGRSTTLMRHSSVDLTMSLYSHSYREDEAVAVDRLPDLSHDPRRQRATGTTDAHAGERDDARLVQKKGGSDETCRDAHDVVMAWVGLEPTRDLTPSGF